MLVSRIHRLLKWCWTFSKVEDVKGQNRNDQTVLKSIQILFSKSSIQNYFILRRAQISNGEIDPAEQPWITDGKLYGQDFYELRQGECDCSLMFCFSHRDKISILPLGFFSIIQFHFRVPWFGRFIRRCRISPRWSESLLFPSIILIIHSRPSFLSLILISFPGSPVQLWVETSEWTLWESLSIRGWFISFRYQPG